MWLFRGGGNGLTAQVLARPVFLKVKKYVHFNEKQIVKKSASVIFGLVRLILLDYNRWRRHMKRCKIIGHPRIVLTRYSVVHKAK